MPFVSHSLSSTVIISWNNLAILHAMYRRSLLLHPPSHSPPPPSPAVVQSPSNARRAFPALFFAIAPVRLHSPSSLHFAQFALLKPNSISNPVEFTKLNTDLTAQQPGEHVLSIISTTQRPESQVHIPADSIACSRRLSMPASRISKRRRSGTYFLPSFTAAYSPSCIRPTHISWFPLPPVLLSRADRSEARHQT